MRCSECMSERGDAFCRAGGAECKKALQLLKLGRVAEDFIEGMACPGGCVGGPSKHKTEIENQAVPGETPKARGRQKGARQPENYPMEKFSMHRDGHMDLRS